MKLFFVVFFLVNSALALGAECQPQGEYRKISQSDDTLSIRTVDEKLQLQLSTAGQVLADGVRTSGAVKGEFVMSDEGCVGAYNNPDEECALFVEFSASVAKVHQFGSCLFGAGAWGGGQYKRLKSHSGKG
jgi:hypothetical protein